MSADFIWKLWNQQYGLPQENFYSNLLHTSRNLLDFKTPQGLQMNFTSCPSSSFANSHRLTIFPNIGGSISFLHSSRAFASYKGTRNVPLEDVLAGYQTINEIQMPVVQAVPATDSIDEFIKRPDIRDTLLYGRIHLPRSKVEAIFARRLSPTRQIILTALSSAKLPNGGTIFAQLQQDHGSHTNEWIYNTDDALIGFRHMRQLGSDPRTKLLEKLAVQDPEQVTAKEALDELPFPQPPADLPLSAYGRFSAGMEIYYGAIHKSGGLSMGMRFSTLPFYHGHPRTMTLTVNPLVGHLSSTYTMKVPGIATVCSRMDFNIFSYESDLTLGAEVWHYPSKRYFKSSSPSSSLSGTDFDDGQDVSHERLGFESDDIDMVRGVSRADAEQRVDGPSGVIKVYVHTANLIGGILWQGRVKDFLVSLGGKFDLSKRAFGAIGVEIQYSS